MKKRIKLGSPEFKQLQQRWYRKLEKKGHIDVERFQDFNKFPASTMPRLHGSFLYDPETGEISDEAEIVPLQETDRAGFWREVGRHAAAMNPGHDRDSRDLYELIFAFAEHGTFMDAAREVGMTRAKAEWRIKKWLAEHDLKEATCSSRQDFEPQPEPGPCRTLTKAEIAKLSYKPPRGK